MEQNLTDLIMKNKIRTNDTEVQQVSQLQLYELHSTVSTISGSQLLESENIIEDLTGNLDSEQFVITEMEHPNPVAEHINKENSTEELKQETNVFTVFTTMYYQNFISEDAIENTTGELKHENNENKCLPLFQIGMNGFPSNVDHHNSITVNIKENLAEEFENGFGTTNTIKCLRPLSGVKQCRFPTTVDRLSSISEKSVSVPEKSPPLTGNTEEKSRKTKTLSCTKCLKIFSKRHKLKRHMMVHSEERPFECKTCLNKFKRKSNLKDHLKTHKKTVLYDTYYKSYSV